MSDAVERLLVEIESQVKGDADLKQFFSEYNKSLREADLSQQQMIARLRELSRAFGAGGGERAYTQFLGDVVRRFNEIGRPLDDTVRRVNEIGKAFQGLDPKVKEVVAKYAASVSDDAFGKLEQAGVRVEQALAKSARATKGTVIEQITAIVREAENIHLPQIDLGKILVAKGQGYSTVAREISALQKETIDGLRASIEDEVGLSTSLKKSLVDIAYTAESAGASFDQIKKTTTETVDEVKKLNSPVREFVATLIENAPADHIQALTRNEVSFGAELARAAQKAEGENKSLVETYDVVLARVEELARQSDKLTGRKESTYPHTSFALNLVTPDEREQLAQLKALREAQREAAENAARAQKAAADDASKAAQKEVIDWNAIEAAVAQADDTTQRFLKKVEETGNTNALEQLKLKIYDLSQSSADATGKFDFSKTFEELALTLPASVRAIYNEVGKVGEEYDQLRKDTEEIESKPFVLIDPQDVNALVGRMNQALAKIDELRAAAEQIPDVGKRLLSLTDLDEKTKKIQDLYAQLQKQELAITGGGAASAGVKELKAVNDIFGELGTNAKASANDVESAVEKLRAALAQQLQGLAQTDPNGANSYREIFTRVLQDTKSFARDAQITNGDQFVKLFFENLQRAFQAESEKFQEKVAAEQKRQEDTVRAQAARLVQLSPEVARGYVSLFQQAREQISRESEKLSQTVSQLQTAPLRGGETQATRFNQIAAAIDALTQRKTQVQQLDAALQQLSNGKGIVDKQALGDARQVVQVIASINREVAKSEQTTQQAQGGWRTWLQLLASINRSETRSALYTLFREIEQGTPLMGAIINPTSTFVQMLNNLIRTGGPVGGVLRSVEGAARGLLGSLQRIGETALGFVVGNILLAPFNALRNTVLGVVGSFDSYVRRAIDLNRQLGKTREEVADDAKVFDQFLLVVSKPVFDFFSAQVNRAGAALSKAFGLGADWKANLFAFGAALGDELRTAASNLLDFGQSLFNGGGALDPSTWLEAGANLAAQFGEGLIQGFIALIPVVASLVQHIADFFIGHSPPPLGALRRIVEGGQGVINEWFRGMLNADFSMLDTLTSAVESRLNLAVANKTLSQAALPGAIASARDAIADMLAELTTNGSVAAGTLERIRGLFGDMWGDVQRVIGAMGEWRNATIAVQAAQDALNAASEHLRAIQEEISNALEAAQEHVKAVQEQVEKAVQAAQDSYEDAQKAVQAIQDKITSFEQNTAEIPERFTRGRKRELDLELIAAQKRAQLAQQYVQDVQKAGQEQQKAAQKELEAIQKNGQERIKVAQKEVEAAQKTLQAAQKEEQVKQAQLQLAERLLQEDIKRNQLAAQRAGMNVDIQFPKIDEALKKAFSGAFEKINEIFKTKLQDDVKVLADFFRTLFTGEVITDVGPEGNQTITQGSQLGLQLRKAFEDAQKAWDKTAPEVLAFLKALFLGESSTDKNGIELEASKAGTAVREMFETIVNLWNNMPEQLRDVFAALVVGHVATGGATTLALLLGAFGIISAIGKKLLEISVIPAAKWLFGGAGNLLGGAGGGAAGDAAALNKGLPLGQFAEGGGGLSAAGIAGMLAGIAAAVTTGVNVFLSNMEFFVGIGERIQSALSEHIEKPFKDAFAKMPPSIGTALSDTFDKVKNDFKARLEQLAGAFLIIGAVGNTIGALVEAALRWLFGEDKAAIEQDLQKRFEEIRATFLTGWEVFVQGIKDAFFGGDSGWNAMVEALFGSGTKDDGRPGSGGLLGRIQSGFDGFVQYLSELKDKIATAIGDAGTWLDQNIAEPFRQLWDTLQGHSILPDIVSAFDAFVAYLTDLPARVAGALGGIAQAVQDAAQGIFAALPQSIQDLLGGGGGEKTQAQNQQGGMAAAVQQEAKEIDATYTALEARTQEFAYNIMSLMAALAADVQARLVVLRDAFILLIGQMIVSALIQFNQLPVGVGLSLNVTETAIYNFIARVETQWASFWIYMQTYAATVASNIAAIVNATLNSLSAIANAEYPGRVGAETDGGFGVGGGAGTAVGLGSLSRTFNLESGLTRVARQGSALLAQAANAATGRGDQYTVQINQSFPEGTPLWDREELRTITHDAAFDAITTVMDKTKNRR